MRVRSVCAVTAIVSSLAGLAHPAAAVTCGTIADLTPVPGDPGAFIIQTAAGPHVSRLATTKAAAAPDVIVSVTNFRFDLDGSAATQIDTVFITAGQTVRWHLGAGIHTVTNGESSADPNAGSLFNATLITGSTDFDFTFPDASVVPYYCEFHELSNMKGVVVVKPAASTPGGPIASRSGFARLPAPNPARGSIGFTIAMVHAADASLDVLDATGRRVATLFRGQLGVGEHPFRWQGVANDGRAAAPGVYRVHLRADGVDATRTFALIR